MAVRRVRIDDPPREVGKPPPRRGSSFLPGAALVIGRIVRYRGAQYDVPAVVTMTQETCPPDFDVPLDSPTHIHLTVFDPAGPYEVLNVPRAEHSDGMPGTWHWPPHKP